MCYRLFTWIHPSILFVYSEFELQEEQSNCRSTEEFPGKTDVFPERCNFSSVSWVCPPGGTCPEPHPRGAQEASLSDAWTNSNGSFQYWGVAALLWAPPGWTPYGISKQEISHPLKKAHLWHLYLRSCSFGHYPELLTTGESRDGDQLVNRQLCFLT